MFNMENGYTGKQLRVLLEKEKLLVENLNENIIREYLGGVGYGAKLLYDELEKGVDPLGRKNKFILTTGPLTANNVPGGGSIELCFKSPLTGGWGESRCGGNFGPDLKKAGFDFVIIEGKSFVPSYLVIDNGKAELKKAEKLKGKTVSEKINILHWELGEDFSIMCVGPAGENLVRYATVMFGGRAAGRTGAGAVMGAKNLLAIAVRGTNEISPAQPQIFKDTVRKAMKIVRENPDTSSFKKHGTIGDLPAVDEAGDLPTKNWQSNSWGKGDQLYDHFYQENLISNNSCYSGCPVACGRITEVEDGPYKTPEHEGSEYESIAAFTAFVINEDMDAAVHSTYLCNEYGIDTISTGGSIAFIMECYEKGIIDNQNTDGLKLEWGNADILPVLVKKIAKRKGIGDLLAEGIKRISKKIGNGSEKFAIQGKGLEAPAHDPRSGKALAVTYGTASRGMCHIHPVEAMAYDAGKMDFGLMDYGLPDPRSVDRWDEKGKGDIVKRLQDGMIIPDILCICKFLMYVGLSLEDYADILSAMTGWDVKGKELIKVGERVINIQRLFNMREGFTIKDDLLPERMMQLPAFGDYQDKERCAIKDYQGMLQEYYQARGWDKKTGKPLKAKLEELNLI